MAGFPFASRVEVLHSASSALSAFQDIVDPSYTPIGGSNYTLCVHRKAGTRVRAAGITVPRDFPMPTAAYGPPVGPPAVLRG
jgi:hypothetical protein